MSQGRMVTVIPWPKTVIPIEKGTKFEGMYACGSRSGGFVSSLAFFYTGNTQIMLYEKCNGQKCCT
jgi:hypothetical protein